MRRNFIYMGKASKIAVSKSYNYPHKIAYGIQTDLKLLRTPSCGAQNMAMLRHILTAAPSSPRFICHRQRSATKPGTRFWGCILYSLHCVIMICLITCKSLIYQRFLVHILKIQAVSINHRKLKVLEKVLEKEQKNKAIYYEMALYQWQGQKDLVSPAGSVGASALRAEVSTGDPHPSTRSACLGV